MSAGPHFFVKRYLKCWRVAGLAIFLLLEEKRLPTLIVKIGQHDLKNYRGADLYAKMQ